MIITYYQGCFPISNKWNKPLEEVYIMSNKCKLK